MQNFDAVAKAYRAYLAAEIPSAISPQDGMYAGNIEHYMWVGRSAIEVVARAMLASGKSQISSVLDLPSGGGRVTRHLRAFFPSAALYVGELDGALEAFAAATFGASRYRAPLDFSGNSEKAFDLVFVGSLVTHFRAELFRQSLRWFISALAPEGLLILTVHGRREDHWERTQHKTFPANRWDRVRRAWQSDGFGFADYPKSPQYGLSLSKPSWVLALVQDNPDVRIVSYQETAWADHQDVLVIQRLPPGGHP